MKNIIQALTITLVILTFNIPTAYAGNGNKLLDACEHVIDQTEPVTDIEQLTVPKLMESFGDGYCLGIVEGAIYMNHIYRTMPDATPVFCRPMDSVNLRSDVKVLVKWLKANPDVLSSDALSTIAWAFSDAYPCK